MLSIMSSPTLTSSSTTFPIPSASALIKSTPKLIIFSRFSALIRYDASSIIAFVAAVANSGIDSTIPCTRAIRISMPAIIISGKFSRIKFPNFVIISVTGPEMFPTLLVIPSNRLSSICCPNSRIWSMLSKIAVPILVTIPIAASAMVGKNSVIICGMYCIATGTIS